ncbi:hypothetical protein VaNZ11_009460, partial [Volvox africanus]
VSINNCPCKSSWSYAGQSYSGCGAILTTSDRLWCAVESSSCPSCSRNYYSWQTCYQQCDWAATPQRCGVSLQPGTRLLPPLQPNPPRPPSPPPAPPPPPPRAVPAACKVSSSGCPCRSTWYQDGKGPASYCASLNGSRSLWCQVTPACTDYATNPYQQCASSLTASQCRSSNGYNYVPVEGNLTFYCSCYNLEPGSSIYIRLNGDLESELARIFNVTLRSVVITSLKRDWTTTYTTAKYVANLLAAGESDPKVAYAIDANSRLKDLISKNFTYKWGSVVTKFPGDSSPSSGQTSTGLTITSIIYICLGPVGFLLVLALIVLKIRGARQVATPTSGNRSLRANQVAPNS